MHPGDAFTLLIFHQKFLLSILTTDSKRHGDRAQSLASSAAGHTITSMKALASTDHREVVENLLSKSLASSTFRLS
jgi:hypothetical protein